MLSKFVELLSMWNRFIGKAHELSVCPYVDHS